MNLNQDKEKIIQEAFNDVQNWLKVTVEKMNASEQAHSAAKKDLDAKSDRVQRIEHESENTFHILDENYQVGSEKYRELTEQYTNWASEHKRYTTDFEALNLLHDSASQKFKEMVEQYNRVAGDHEKAVKAKKAISESFNQEFSKYNEEKAYFDSVDPFYRKALELQEIAQKSQKDFEEAVAEMKKFLTGSHGTSFPINESTGFNYVDEYNMPEVLSSNGGEILANKTELNLWFHDYQLIYEKVEKSTVQFSKNLKNYQEQFSLFIKIGGEKVIKLGNPGLAYRGIDVDALLNKLSLRILEWQEEYSKRERAFIPVVKFYQHYLSESEKLNDTITKVSSTEKGLQEMFNLLNSFANYSDIYNPNHRNINVLASILRVDVADLTRPRSNDELKQLVQEKYVNQLQALNNSYLEDFIVYFNRIRANYDLSISQLQNQLRVFERATGISVKEIKIENSLSTTDHIKEYFKRAIEINTRELFSVMSDSSSFVNSLKKVKHFERVINSFVIDDSDNAMSFPEKSITAITNELESSLLISEIVGIDEPVQPEKPEWTYQTLEAPEKLSDKPIFIEDISEPVEMKNQHKALQKPKLKIIA